MFNLLSDSLQLMNFRREIVIKNNLNRMVQVSCTEKCKASRCLAIKPKFSTITVLYRVFA